MKNCLENDSIESQLGAASICDCELAAVLLAGLNSDEMVVVQARYTLPK